MEIKLIPSQVSRAIARQFPVETHSINEFIWTVEKKRGFEVTVFPSVQEYKDRIDYKLGIGLTRDSGYTTYDINYRSETPRGRSIRFDEHIASQPERTDETDHATVMRAVERVQEIYSRLPRVKRVAMSGLVEKEPGYPPASIADAAFSRLSPFP